MLRIMYRNAHFRREIAKHTFRINIFTEDIQILQDGKICSPRLSYVEVIHDTSPPLKFRTIKTNEQVNTDEKKLISLSLITINVKKY